MSARRRKADVPRIANAYDALVQALVLALTASDGVREARAVALAEDFAMQVAPDDLKRAMDEALAVVDGLRATVIH